MCTFFAHPKDWYRIVQSCVLLACVFLWPDTHHSSGFVESCPTRNGPNDLSYFVLFFDMAQKVPGANLNLFKSYLALHFSIPARSLASPCTTPPPPAGKVMVSGGGPAARAPPPGSPSPGRARAARPLRSVGTGHRAQGGGAGGLAAGLGTAHPGRPRRDTGPGGPGPACPRRAARREGTARPRAPVCALTARRAHGGHLLATPGCFAHHSKSVLSPGRISWV